MGTIGWQEMILVLVVLLLLFGAKRLPEMGRSLGRGMREFKDAVTGETDEEPEKTALSAPAAPSPPPAAEERKSEHVSS